MIRQPIPIELVRRRFLQVLSVSLFVTLLLPIFHFHAPTRSLEGRGTDHISHWGSAILLEHEGFGIYRHPVRELCSEPQTVELPAKPQDLCSLRDSAGPQFVVNWQQYPRVYPLGAVLYSLGEGLLYEWAHLSFEHTNVLTIMKYLLVAHLVTFLLFGLFFQRSEDAEAPLGATDWRWAALLLVLPAVHLELVGWSAFGIYDGLSIALLLMSIPYLRARRPVEALLVLSLALFTHFRALWFVPLYLAATAELIMGWRTRKLTNRQWGMLAAAGVITVVAMYCFWCVWPALGEFPIKNPVHLSVLAAKPTEWLSLAFPLIAALALLAQQRSWLTAGAVAWQFFTVLETREMRGWHSLFMLPLIGLAATEKEKQSRLLSVAAVVALYLWECSAIFGTRPLSGAFLAELWRG